MATKKTRGSKYSITITDKLMRSLINDHTIRDSEFMINWLLANITMEDLHDAYNALYYYNMEKVIPGFKDQELKQLSPSVSEEEVNEHTSHHAEKSSHKRINMYNYIKGKIQG